MIAERDKTYIIWQNRAFRLYPAARTCWRKKFHTPAVFLSHQIVELLLKATLIYWDYSTDPKTYRHDLEKLLQSIKGNTDIPGRENFTIPEYFIKNSHEFQTVSRYPEPNGSGYVIPGTLLSDLDRLFTELVEMVPFQFNSELYRTLRRKEVCDHNYVELKRGNKYIDRLCKHVGCLVEQ